MAEKLPSSPEAQEKKFEVGATVFTKHNLDGYTPVPKDTEGVITSKDQIKDWRVKFMVDGKPVTIGVNINELKLELDEVDDEPKKKLYEEDIKDEMNGDGGI